MDVIAQHWKTIRSKLILVKVLITQQDTQKAKQQHP